MRSTERLATRTDTSDSSFDLAPRGVRARVLEAIRQRPRSVDELMHDLCLSHSTCSAAVNHLMRRNLVMDLGVRTTTRSGRTAIVWEENPGIPPNKKVEATRAQLLDRIDLAIQEIDRNHGHLTYLRRILTGEVTDER